MMTRIRNRGCMPFVKAEGNFVKPLPTAVQIGSSKGSWYSGLKPFERMFYHHTLASVRRYAYFEPFSDLIPRNELDLALASSYDHAFEEFPDKVDTYMQPETLGTDTWRRLRNTRDMQAERETKVLSRSDRYNYSHPVFVGGIKERRHPSNVKLMNSSYHSPQTNAGYSRQDSDGNVFKY